MSRFIATLVVGSLLGLGVHAQESKVKSETKSSGGDVKTISYTGCVQTGTQTKTYILEKVVPVATTTAESVGTSGTTRSTSTTYALVPDEKVEVQEHVGHKVEVTGLMIPAGDVKTTTETKTDDSKTKETVKAENAMPQFRVLSIKKIADTCS